MKSEKLRSGCFWPWAISLAFHGVLLAVFGVITFQKALQRENHASTPAAVIQSVRKLEKLNPVMPKPKFKPLNEKLSSMPVRPESVPEEAVSKLPAETAIPSGEIFDIGRENFRDLGETDFFGGRTYARRICYVVDCSGSMQGLFASVRKELKESISLLQADQYFSVLFFQSDDVTEFQQGQLVRATRSMKSKGYAFIDSMTPEGSTRAAAALYKGMQVRDASGEGPEHIYLLTDGLDLTQGGPEQALAIILKLHKKYVPSSRITCLGFWPEKHDREVLSSIAQKTGGQFICIE